MQRKSSSNQEKGDKHGKFISCRFQIVTFSDIADMAEEAGM